MYNYVRVRMRNTQDTEDVVAEAYLRAARSFSSFDPERAKFSTWVVRIAVNCMNDHYRKTRHALALDDVSEAELSLPGEQEHLDDYYLVDRLLGCLNAEERELVAMKYHEGYRNVEIAEELGMNLSTVSTKLARAIQKMRSSSDLDS